MHACLIEQGKYILIAYTQNTHTCTEESSNVGQSCVSMSQCLLPPTNDLSGEQSFADDCHKDIFAVVANQKKKKKKNKKKYSSMAAHQW